MTTSCDIPQVCHNHIIDMIRNGAVSWHNEQMLNSWDVVTEVNSHHMMSATSCRSDHMHSMASAYSLKWIRWKIITGYPSNSKSCFKLCLLMHQVHTGRAPSYHAVASPHQPTSLHVLVCAPPAVDVRKCSARVWSLENDRFCVLDHHCINSLTLRLSNDN